LGKAYYNLNKKKKAFDFLGNAVNILKEIESPEVSMLNK
jgi:hypothetical protein